jgi:hypothetical protein
MLLPAEVRLIIAERSQPTITMEPALARADALEVLEKLRSARVFVLGGDAAYRNGGAVLYAHDNWTTNRQDGEQVGQFRARCLEASISYVSNYPERSDCEILFGLSIFEAVDQYGRG